MFFVWWKMISSFINSIFFHFYFFNLGTNKRATYISLSMKSTSLAPIYWLLLSACVIQAQVFSNSVTHCLKKCNELWQACVTACGPNLGSCTKCTSMAESCRGTCFQTNTTRRQLNTKKSIREFSSHSRKEHDSVSIESSTDKASSQRVEYKSIKQVKQVFPLHRNGIPTMNDELVEA